MPTIPHRSMPRAPAPPRNIPRAYLHHLIKSGEILSAMLLSWANVQFYEELMARARAAIAAGDFARFTDDVLRRYSTASDEDDAD